MDHNNKNLGPEYTKLPEKTRCHAPDMVPQPINQDQFVSELVNCIVPKAEASRSYNTKVCGKVLNMDNIRKEALAKSKSKSKLCKNENRVKPLSSKKKKELKTYSLKSCKIKYSEILPMNSMWQCYIKELIDFKLDDAQILQKFLRADYHGAIITVIRSKCPSYVGHTGIVLKETKNMFYILNKEDELKGITL